MDAVSFRMRDGRRVLTFMRHLNLRKIMSKFAKLFAISALLVGFTVGCSKPAEEAPAVAEEAVEAVEVAEEEAVEAVEAADEAAEEAVEAAEEAVEAAGEAVEEAEEAAEEAAE